MLHGSSWWIVGVACLVGAISVLVEVAPADGWTSGLAVLTGATAYTMISVNLLLAVRRPFLERHFGPLDRIYGHPDREYLEAAGERNGDGVEWYVCGPAALAALVDRVVEGPASVMAHDCTRKRTSEWRWTGAAAAKPSTVD